MADLTKKPDDSVNKTGGTTSKARGIQKTGGGIKINSNTNLPALQRKLREAKAAEAAAPATDATALANRIGLMLDCSGSMGSAEDRGGKAKIELLKDAMLAFLGGCNFTDTSCAVNTFPHSDGQGCVMKLTNNPVMLNFALMGLQDHGGTPMHRSMQEMLESESITRAIIVSDGDADSGEDAREQARCFANAEIMIDCVHIGRSSGGEALLAEIAKITGGLYIKFTDVENFAKNFSYLTPAKRYLALAPGAASLLGATEIKS